MATLSVKSIPVVVEFKRWNQSAFSVARMTADNAGPYVKTACPEGWVVWSRWQGNYVYQDVVDVTAVTVEVED